MMGNIIRMARYDRAGNMAAAIPALDFAGGGASSNSNPLVLKWYRLDDGVMGGRSETHHESISSGNALHFTGTINTEGGGFTSIRADFPGLPVGTEAIRIKFKGDGKTYKVLLSDGPSTGSPFSGSPSWQADLPTKKFTQKEQEGGDDENKKIGEEDDDQLEEVTLPLHLFQPSFGPRAVSDDEKKNYKLIPSEMRQVGIMLSLLLSDGSPNPLETFGTGLFDFCLFVIQWNPLSVKVKKPARKKKTSKYRQNKNCAILFISS